MKINQILLNILLILFCSYSFGQKEDQYAKQIDSVQNLINSNQEEPREKVRLLNEVARLHFYNVQIKEGFIATKTAINLAEEIGFDEGRVMYYLTLSAYQGLGNNEMYIYYQKKAEWLSESFGNQSRNYFVELDIPEVNLGNDFEQLREEFSDILPLFEAEEDKEIRVNLLTGINYYNFRLNRFEEVLEGFDRISSIFKDLGQVYPIFLFSTYKIQILNSLGKLEESKNTELELVKLFVSSEDENAIGLIASTMASGYVNSGRFLLSIEYYLKSIEEFEQVNDLEMLSRQYHELGVAYENLDMNSKAVESYKKSIDVLEALNDHSNLMTVYGSITFPLIAMEEYEQATKYMNLAGQDTISAGSNFRQARLWDARGQILLSQEKYNLAVPYFEKALNVFQEININHWAVPFMYLYIAECNLQTGNTKQALSNALRCLENTGDGETRVARKVNLLLSNIYEKMGDESLALKHLRTYQEIVEKSNKNDELSRIADAEIKSILDKSKKEIIELEREQELVNQRNKIQRLWLFSAAGALLSALLVLYILFRNNRNKQRINAQLRDQKEKVELTLEKLKSTQSQLIQSEKMASLGELTAGIAHEIQNPLNFVNNFSELSAELVEEMKEELEAGNGLSTVEIADDIKQNLKKILHHGKRAEGIVKGMLQHSRTSTGQKELTDINVLVDEYLRLAYHGLRAKDKTFNADFRLEADEGLPGVHIIGQDIGRVLLNLINNAFFSVSERTRQAENGYKPEVVVKTRKLGDQVEIRVKDNGTGIPDEIKEKIFQPFFTTKATGEGTGLGLSLSYDIITKGHGGKLEVESTEGAGSQFIIYLPITSTQ